MISFIKKNNSEKTQKQGFALLIGVVIAAILISISYTLFSITLKQVTLSIAGKGSQLAFYAADTGLECALFADYKIDKAFVDADAFPTLAVPQTSISSPPLSYSCNGNPMTVSSLVQNNILIKNISYNGVVVSSFIVKAFNYSTGHPSCANVVVNKYIDGGVLKTDIKSYGYNTCINTNDPQRLERGLEVFF